MDVVQSINGVAVRLTKERWEHIVSGHPEMSEFYLEILAAVTTPDAIYAGHKDAKIAIKRLKETFNKLLLHTKRRKTMMDLS